MGSTKTPFQMVGILQSTCINLIVNKQYLKLVYLGCGPLPGCQWNWRKHANTHKWLKWLTHPVGSVLRNFKGAHFLSPKSWYSSQKVTFFAHCGALVFRLAEPSGITVGRFEKVTNASCFWALQLRSLKRYNLTTWWHFNMSQGLNSLYWGWSSNL